jgi:UDP-N-acetyl-D-mannosaminuronic acid dehydrogenase
MQNQHRKVCVIGLGYIGLPTAALLANRGYQVHGVDVVKHVVDTINKGEIHIIEPDLDAFVHSAVNSGHLKADTKPTEAEVFMIAVPTPFHEDQSPNIDYVIAATKAIAKVVKPGNAIILESTSPVGTTELVKATLDEAGIDTSTLFFAYCPERVLPGQVMKELIENDRIVGGLNPESTAVVAAFYRNFVKGEVLETNAKTAEMCKLTENASRDAGIAFANELSMICDKIGIDVWELISLANKHPRVNILKPGPGVGGHCIAVDPWFIVHRTPKEAKLIRTAREVNKYKTEWAIEKILRNAFEWKSTQGTIPKLAVMGLAFKPEIDDLRESPALQIYQKLKSEAIVLMPVEPHIEEFEGKPLTGPVEAVAQADIIVFLVAHKAFKKLKIDSSKVVIDFCGFLQ